MPRHKVLQFKVESDKSMAENQVKLWAEKTFCSHKKLYGGVRVVSTLAMKYQHCSKLPKMNAKKLTAW